jgi:hypothetical protein
MSYKCNQVEEAIARISPEAPSEFRTRIKRLLELDRSMGRKIRCKDAEEANFAFFSKGQRLKGHACRSGRGREPA